MNMGIKRSKITKGIFLNKFTGGVWNEKVAERLIELARDPTSYTGFEKLLGFVQENSPYIDNS